MIYTAFTKWLILADALIKKARFVKWRAITETRRVTIYALDAIAESKAGLL